MKTSITAFCFFLVLSVSGQDIYKDSLQRYIDHYISTHEVIKGEDRKHLRFFPIDQQYRVVAKLERQPDSKWLSMETSAGLKKNFRVYALLHFSIHDTLIKLPVYQSQNLMAVEQYKTLLFLPFTDRTSGEETYSSGRYIDLWMTDIRNDSLVVDFNKAYNPYCAYASGVYNCPIPPKENQLPVAIMAGEKLFQKTN